MGRLEEAREEMWVGESLLREEAENLTANISKPEGKIRKQQDDRPLTNLLRCCSCCFFHCSRSESREVWVETLTPSTWACESRSVDLLLSNFPHVHLKPAVSQCTNDDEHMCDACISPSVRRMHSFIQLRPPPIIFLPPKQRSAYIFFLWCSLTQLYLTRLAGWGKLKYEVAGLVTENKWCTIYISGSANDSERLLLMKFLVTFTLYATVDIFDLSQCTAPGNLHRMLCVVTIYWWTFKILRVSQTALTSVSVTQPYLDGELGWDLLK